MDFIKFISLFQNLIFLKIYVKTIDLVFKKMSVTCTSKIYKTLKHKSKSKLEYLEITINEDITTSLPILFAWSHFFDISNLNILVLQYVKLHENDVSVISNLKSLKELHMCFYQQENEIF
ncbi:hypothetical protein CWI36_0302p0030 [Hamiltosporidium magnivora]|uniref:Uncharacterized protein n=1 Tax=Hamiltosporidium magnivora TaxID=148818 RepID=A0A4Q9LGM1_9MICR|nr:hypothetical protein CWI36_0803p0010 [Hamiltosporidium magnivora]TBU07249.1 hypothetical protein CWI36_0302p0030 [Hamiltosporidium magnivora]